MQRSERHRTIIRALDSGRRTVDELATLTGASTISIRRDLVELAEQGALRRVRGGAEPATRRGVEYPFALRRDEDASLKAALGRAAATLIRPGDAVLIDNGTTALAVAREIAGTGITALALSLHAAAALAARPGDQVIVPGGAVDHDDLAFTGASAVDAVRGMRFDVAVLGACAADPDTGLTVAGWGDALVKRAALAASRRVVLVATPDKFARTAAHRFGGIADLDAIVTTRDAPIALLHDARQAGVEVVLVDADADADGARPR
ncbi:DeoR/GlpR family DNA-binding transcription regulator [Clavibacter phaseoli]|uniref:DeoR/GlpR family DNA-binding transcription regulator n=1 Tax=Clavibacter phaseoli TaxID=1734031 RepID=UPI000E6694D6|nr:DeoR/GlpR family DNA-binding transcription regulator [Clavibacter phaseoli]RIJ55085.1 DeoR/GlpR transcriptional regulator [Clavibacter phaseoli]UKF31341.1 DeoR/GlpR transcriptional regulator [Clavibacter phaseoli]UKF37260.1 DeoR/GlpR transcriptional regulator [Clavibacter phaseoli]